MKPVFKSFMTLFMMVLVVAVLNGCGGGGNTPLAISLGNGPFYTGIPITITAPKGYDKYLWGGDVNGSEREVTKTFPAGQEGKKTITLTVWDGNESKSAEANLTLVTLPMAEKVADFKAKADNAHQLFTGCYEMQYDDACWADEDGVMVPTDTKLEYYTQAGVRGENKGVSDHKTHWHLNYTQRMKDDNIPPLLNLGSAGLYDVVMWNANVGEYIEYNTTAQFFVNTHDGAEIISLVSIYSIDFDGTENRRSIYNPALVIFSKSYPLPEMGYKVLSETIQDYVAKEGNFHGFPVGTVIKDCLYTEIDEPESIVEDDNIHTRIKTIVCGEGYGLVDMNITSDPSL